MARCTRTRIALLGLLAVASAVAAALPRCAAFVHPNIAAGRRCQPIFGQERPRQIIDALTRSTAPKRRRVAPLAAATDPYGEDESGGGGSSSALQRAASAITSNPSRSITFSALITLCGAGLGPFLDSYHSAFGVLQYDEPIYLQLWGSSDNPALITAWWVPELFGLAGFIIGWLYIALDAAFDTTPESSRTPTGPKILAGISFFTFQYWLSGILSATGSNRTVMLDLMSALCMLGYFVFDGTTAGFITSVATAVGGPLIEIGLITFLVGHGGYHYTDSGETGFFPLWIVPVYFLGGPAVGNLSRGIWNTLSQTNAAPETIDAAAAEATDGPRCNVCNDTRAVGCPNCDALGYYVTYGRKVTCPACKGRGLVICRNCFASYGDDPNDIEAIRDIMAKMPD